jgi:dipeptidyl aminopeptidase/acylaminoacyl peptidase
MVASQSIRLGQIAIDGDDIYWTEQRPEEGGRNVIVKYDANGNLSDLTPPPFNARTLAHEYGGGAFLVDEGVIYFSNFKDQRLYRQQSGQPPAPITPESACRFADGVFDKKRDRIICVREDHSSPNQEPTNCMVAIHLNKNHTGEMLIAGNDFYSSPRLSPDGACLAWLTWNHPNLPWDGAELWVGEIQEGGGVGNPVKVAGGATESIFQPEWSPDNVLYFISDRSGWWNLYRWQNGRVEAVIEKAAEFGLPQWVFGLSTYGFLDDNQIVCSFFENGRWHLARLDTQNLTMEIIPTEYSVIEEVRVAKNFTVFRGGSPTSPSSIVKLDVRTRRCETLRRAWQVEIDPGYLSQPQSIEFPSENGLTAFAYFYPPKNRDYRAPAAERPPLIVRSHGGPTSAASTALDLRTQFWTSRGFAVLDVNYGGSSGYGRAYRQRLNGNWGVVDVDDCINGAKYLVEKNLVDGNRTIIVGGSAGGYTTLAALAFRNFFKAGASYYGICDLQALAEDTHKFESRYLNNLIGPYPARRDLYRARSPIHFTERLSCPIILFQGLEDKVVPPNQAEKMLAAVREKGLPVAYVPFAGEQHGFRKAASIQRALEAELYFYSKIFSFELSEDLPAVEIENLKP